MITGFGDEVHRRVNTLEIIPVFGVLPVLRCARLDFKCFGAVPDIVGASKETRLLHGGWRG